MYIGEGLRIPQGFAGQNDIWHYHTNVCLVIKPGGDIDVPFGIDTTVTKDSAHRQRRSVRCARQVARWDTEGQEEAPAIEAPLDPATRLSLQHQSTLARPA